MGIDLALQQGYFNVLTLLEHFFHFRQKLLDVQRHMIDGMADFTDFIGRGYDVRIIGKIIGFGDFAGYGRSAHGWAL